MKNEIQDLIDKAHARKHKNTYIDNWQLIETAPKDGTRILATDGYEVEKIRWQRGVWVIRNCSDPFYDEEWDENTPTHWMPLPKPPEEKGE